MFFTFVWFGEKRQAIKAGIILGIITSVFLLAALGMWLTHNYKINNYKKVTGVVTASDATDRTKTWTELTYKCNGVNQTVRLNRIYFRAGLKKELLCNPDSPSEASLYSSSSTISLILLISAIPFGLFTSIYLFNYYCIHRKEVKEIQ